MIDDLLNNNIQKIAQILELKAALLLELQKDNELQKKLARCALSLADIIKAGGCIYSCGNGGSACDAIHLTEELTARFKRHRPGMKAQHFMDAATISCWANDYSFETVFERQVKTFCSEKDALIVFSTSGNSSNILKAAAAAKKKNTLVIGILGKGGGKVAPLCDIAILPPGNDTERIQEFHLSFVHVLCELLEG